MRLEAFAVERAIAADPDLFLLGRLAASQQPAAPAAAGPRIPYRYPATLSYENSSIKEQISAVLLQMACRFADKHGECVSCLGAAHAETALTGTEYHHCGDMSLLSALAASFLFREQTCPSRPLAFFFPGTCEEKAAGQSPEMSELMLAVPPLTSLFPTESFLPFSSPARTSIPLWLRQRSGLIR